MWKTAFKKITWSILEYVVPFMFHWEKKLATPWTQYINWTHRGRLEDVPNVFWMSYVRLMNVLCPGGDTIYYLTRGFLLHQIYKWSISFAFTHFNKKLYPRLKLVRIILEISNLARKYTHICSFRKYTFNTKVLLILLNCFAKNQRFLVKIAPLLKAMVWELR